MERRRKQLRITVYGTLVLSLIAGFLVHPKVHFFWEALPFFSALYGFVGMQMAWVLRPWIGAWSQDYTPFRPLSGSIFKSVWHLVKQALM